MTSLPMSWRQRRHCPHSNIRGIYGDAINVFGGYRLQCMDCDRLLGGPVSLAEDRQHEADLAADV